MVIHKDFSYTVSLYLFLILIVKIFIKQVKYHVSITMYHEIYMITKSKHPVLKLAIDIIPKALPLHLLITILKNSVNADTITKLLVIIIAN